MIKSKIAIAALGLSVFLLIFLALYAAPVFALKFRVRAEDDLSILDQLTVEAALRTVIAQTVAALVVAFGGVAALKQARTALGQLQDQRDARIADSFALACQSLTSDSQFEQTSGILVLSNLAHSNSSSRTVYVECIRQFILNNSTEKNPRDVVALAVATLMELRVSAKFVSLFGSNLTGLKLRNLCLDNIDFESADLSYSDISGSTFSGSALSKARLRDLVVGDANLDGADIPRLELLERIK